MYMTYAMTTHRVIFLILMNEHVKCHNYEESLKTLLVSAKYYFTWYK